MEETAGHRQDPDSAPDLAAIVLAAPPRGRNALAPERVPVTSHDGGRDTAQRGYDARSVLVLALVVAVLAAVIGWTTSIGEDSVSAPDLRAMVP